MDKMYKEFKHKWNGRELDCQLYKSELFGGTYELNVYLNVDGHIFCGSTVSKDEDKLIELAIKELEKEIIDYSNDEYMDTYEKNIKHTLYLRRRTYNTAKWLRDRFIKG